MKLPSIITNTGRMVRAKSPELLMVAGIAALVGTVVTTIKATLSAPEVIDKHKEAMEEVRALPEEPIKKKETTRTYVRTGMSLAKLYAPAIALGVLTVTAFLASNRILKKRNVALAAAYTAVEKAFNEYRERVKEKFGEEVEKDILLGVEEQEIEVVDENGKKKKQKVKVANGKGNAHTKYMRPSNPFYKRDPAHAEAYFNLAQSTVNLRLQVHQISGICSLEENEVWRELSLEEDVDFMSSGFVYDINDRSNNLQNYIQFNVETVYLPNQYSGELEKCYAITLTPDGNIQDIIKKKLSARKAIA